MPSATATTVEVIEITSELVKYWATGKPCWVSSMPKMPRKLCSVSVCGIQTAGLARISMLRRKAVSTTQAPGTTRISMAMKTPRRMAQRCQGRSTVMGVLTGRLP